MGRVILAAALVAVLAGVCLAGPCPACKAMMPEGAKFCPSCGVAIVAACPKCGAALPEGSQFCPQCGFRVREPSPGGAGQPAGGGAGQPAGGGAGQPAAPVQRSSEPFDPRNLEADRALLSFGAFTNEDVEKRIQGAAAYLLGAQRTDGSWDPIKMYESTRSGMGGTPAPGQKFTMMHQVGATGMAVYALLESGLSVRDERMVRALEWLTKSKADMTYDVAFRASAYATALRAGAVQYRRPLQADVKLLVDKTNRGGYTYHLREGYARDQYDQSNSQYALLAVWAAAQADVEVPGRYWQEAWGHWRYRQNGDGGWGYDAGSRTTSAAGTAAMATAGLASLFVCYDQLYGGESVGCGTHATSAGSIDRGMKWLEKNFAASFAPGAVQSLHYHLYGVERVGLASGFKTFGGLDWYAHGASLLLTRDAGRPWGDVVEPAYTILFLARGRNPVLLNKLKRPGDWNNRPRDLANLTRWLGRNAERTVAWQIADLDGDPADWREAPILYISGAAAPVVSDAQAAKLLRYVREGGTIVSVAECNGGAFRAGIRKLYARLFPDYELAPAGKGHDLYSREAPYPLTGGPAIHVVSNGTRVLAFHCDQDLALDWQTNRTVAKAVNFQVMFNIMRLVTDRPALLRHRGQSHWPDAASLARATPPEPVLRLVRLKFAGNYDPEPLAMERFRQVMAVRENTRVEIVAPVAIDQLAAQKARFAHLAGTGRLTLTTAEVAALKAFVDGGGTLLIEAVGGSAVFAQTAQQYIPGICPDRPLADLPADSPLLTLPGMQIKSVTYGRATTQRLGRTGPVPVVKAVLFEKTPRLYLSREDITTALLGCPYVALDGYSSRSAMVLLRNMLQLSAQGQ